MSVVAAIAAESDGVGIRQDWRVGEVEPPPGRRPRVSRAKVRANRRNGRRSTGPRTAAGKARARTNALAHGAYCADLLLPGEDAAGLEEQRRQFVAAWAPADACELLLVEQMLSAAWRLRRVGATENGLHRWAGRMAWERRRRAADSANAADASDDAGDAFEPAADPPPAEEPPELSVVGEGLWYCLQYPDAGGRELEALGRAEQRLLGTVLRCSRELRQLKLLRLRDSREAGEPGETGETREMGETVVSDADADAGAGDAADGPNAVDATAAGDGADAAAAPAASPAPPPPPQPRARPGIVGENLAVGSFRAAAGAGSAAVPLFEPADPTPREAAWCGAPPVPIHRNQR